MTKGRCWRDPVTVRDNTIRSTSPLLLRSVGDRLVFSDNKYMYPGFDKPSWLWNGKTWDSLASAAGRGRGKGQHAEHSVGRPEARRRRFGRNHPEIGNRRSRRICSRSHRASTAVHCPPNPPRNIGCSSLSIFSSMRMG